MDAFFVGLVVLFSMSAVFYVVLFSFIFYWHLRRISFVVVPMVFTFDFFLIGFLIISIIYLVIKYLPDLIKILQS
jgi:hypothetical protein